MSLPPAISSPNSPGWSRHIERLRAATKGRFTIVRELGRGGFAAVFLAQQLQPNRRVAIKLLLPAHLDSTWALEHFRAECEKISEWRHQSIITIYEVHELDDLFFFVMTYVEGASLYDLIHKLGPLPIPIALSVFAQMGSALNYAHRQGVTHRDIKPPNVLIDVDGGAVVTDFGIAKDASATSYTVTGMLFGTPSYMAPETCQNGTTSAASDQYALGIVAYEMLTGEPPFSGPPTSVLIAHLQDPVPPIRAKRRDCPAALEATIMRMLAKDPADRFPSIGEAIQAAGAMELPETHPERRKFAQAARDLAREAHAQIVDIQTIPPRLEVGDRIAVDATARTLTGEAIPAGAVEWSIDDQGVARLEADSGTLTALEPGSTTLFMRSGNTVQQIRVDVVPPIVATVQLSAPATALRVGERTQLVATPRSKNGIVVTRTTTWYSEDPSLAVVTADGVLEARAPGRTRVRAEVDDVSADFWIEVTAPPQIVAPAPPPPAPTRTKREAPAKPAPPVRAAPAAPPPVARPPRVPEPVAASTPAYDDHVPARTEPRRGANPVAMIGGAVALVAVAVIGVFAFKGDGAADGDSGAATPPVTAQTPAPSTPPPSSPAPATQQATPPEQKAAPPAVREPERTTPPAGRASTQTARGSTSQGTARGAVAPPVTPPTNPPVETPPVVAAPPPRTYSLTAPVAVIHVGDTVAMRLTASDGDALPPVSWSTSDAQRATISSNGVVRGTGAGIVTIIARVGAAQYVAQLSVQPAEVVRAPDPPARPPVTEPPPPSATELAAAAERDVRQLVRDYAAALSSRDVSNVVRLYPSMPAPVRTGWTQMFRTARDFSASYAVERVDLARTPGTARVSGEHRYTNPDTRRACVVPLTLDIRVVSSANGWRVAGVDQVGTATGC